MTTNPNDQVTPLYGREESPTGGVRFITQGGLTKRELFAVVALEGLLADRSIIATTCPKLAVEAADALIKELSK